MVDKKSKISEEEREKRQEAVDYARASTRLSGIICDEAFEARAAKYVRGDMDLDEFVNGE